MKKWVGIALAVLLALSLFSGCAKKEASAPAAATVPDSEKKKTQVTIETKVVSADISDLVKKYREENEATARVLKKLGATDEEIKKILPDDSKCATCHPQHFYEWTKSKHYNPVVFSYFAFQSYASDFKKNLDRFPKAKEWDACFRACHGPTMKYASDKVKDRLYEAFLSDDVENLRGIRVGCITCHSMMVEGELGDTYYGTIEDPEAPHDAKFSREMSTSEFCKPCHSKLKIDFVTPEVKEALKMGDYVQCGLNYDAWAQSDVKREKECQYCHMQTTDEPAANGGDMRIRHRHDFPGPNSPAMMVRAARVNLDAHQMGNVVHVKIEVKNLAEHILPDGCILAAKPVLHVYAYDEKGNQIFYTNETWKVGSYDYQGKFTGSVWKVWEYDTSVMFNPGKWYNFEYKIPYGSAKKVTVKAVMMYHDSKKKESRPIDPVPSATLRMSNEAVAEVEL